MLSLSIKKETSKFWIIIDLFPSYLLVLNCLRKSFLIQFFQHLTLNKLLNPNQSGFMPGDSCIHQLISTAHEIYASFDANPTLEVRGVFLNISKSFDRVWQERLIYKITCMDVKSGLLALIESFFIRKITKSCYEYTIIWMADNQSCCSSWFSSWSIVFWVFLYTY